MSKKLRMVERVASAHINNRVAQEKPSKVMFSQAVLDTPRDLLNWFQDQTGLNPESSGWKVAAHHMTIEFYDKKDKKKLKSEGKSESNLLAPLEGLMGRSVILDIVGYAHDDKGMAVLVEPKGPLARLVKNVNPHITVATKGVGAKYSNELLEKGEIIPARGSLQARVGWKNPRESVDLFDLPWDFGE
jgi:hypothetical protein